MKESTKIILLWLSTVLNVVFLCLTVFLGLGAWGLAEETIEWEEAYDELNESWEKAYYELDEVWDEGYTDLEGYYYECLEGRE
tara:strand:+ start:8677 stop:8925 length:249 start_codon:yes stop_codon:yes gene_type:complete